MKLVVYAFIAFSFLCTLNSNFAFADDPCIRWAQQPDFRDFYLASYVENDDRSAVGQLFQCGLTTKYLNNLKYSLLELSFDRHHPNMARLLLSHGANPNPPGSNLLRIAILNSWKDLAVELITAGISSDSIQDSLNTAIVEPISTGPSPDMVNLLLTQHVDPNYGSAEDASALEKVSSSYEWISLWEYQQPKDHIKKTYKNYEEIASALLKAGANPNSDDGKILYHFYSSWPDSSFLELLRMGANPNLKLNSSAATAFTRILDLVNNPGTGYCFPEWLDRVESLLVVGANPKLAYPSGYPKFHCNELQALVKKYGY